uniref:Secretion system C-terminal sorting domain-containing protein n=1 Tax=Prevotella sp. GTC17253 TaxID=3236793 RepID=A0AB33IWN0_9BACT
MKRDLFIFMLLCFAFASQAQSTMSYAYDQAGNRVSRVIVLKSRAVKSQSHHTDSMSFREMLSDRQIKIWPNPVQTELTVSISQFDSSSSATYSLYHPGGSVLEVNKPLTQSTAIDMTKYPRGIYILRITLYGQSSSWKIIKQ